ncbi:hypothetical protein L873DRAFT_1827501 [Choiromyces venosus 120613-1]|uniref:Uncharacterized protein n=1 Tax=Choiromyces venosus 120613-1 TaxID=1336337 RepID=A0A3N4JUI3_9PEZI|nr:hypothetical protein L873DRAFT_1827501 [Choiromyces venosus 120613-1]
MTTPPLPAHLTKHLPTLYYPLPSTPYILTLTQSQSSSSSTSSEQTTGTTLWLSSQLLSYHLLTLFPSSPSTPQRSRGVAIDLGAGIGLTSHTLSHLNFRVYATDVPAITSGILSQNISQNANLPAGGVPIVAHALDWTLPLSPADVPWSREEVEVIVTADTFYKLELVEPLVRTIRGLCVESARCAEKRGGGRRKRYPLVLVAVEVRDRGVLGAALETAAREGFECRRIGDGRVKKGLEAAGVRWGREEWEGGEIWRWVFKGEGSERESG